MSKEIPLHGIAFDEGDPAEGESDAVVVDVEELELLLPQHLQHSVQELVPVFMIKSAASGR